MKRRNRNSPAPRAGDRPRSDPRSGTVEETAAADRAATDKFNPSRGDFLATVRPASNTRQRAHNEAGHAKTLAACDQLHGQKRFVDASVVRELMSESPHGRGRDIANHQRDDHIRTDMDPLSSKAPAAAMPAENSAAS